MVYVGDGIFLGNDDMQLLQAIKEIQGLGVWCKRGWDKNALNVTF
jgi:hypothetical protein